MDGTDSLIEYCENEFYVYIKDPFDFKSFLFLWCSYFIRQTLNTEHIFITYTYFKIGFYAFSWSMIAVYAKTLYTI